MSNVKILDAKNSLDSKVLDALEQSWAMKLPKDYRDFLLEYNGGSPDKTLFHFINYNNKRDSSLINEFFGIYKSHVNNLLQNIKDIGDRYPLDSFPIADDQFGNRICLIVKGKNRGKVYFWDHELEVEIKETDNPYCNMFFIANSFNDFLNMLEKMK